MAAWNHAAIDARVAVVAAYATAYFGRDLLVPFLRSYLQLPDVVISALGGAILAVAVYGIIASLGTLLFKRTAQQDSGTMRLVYGLSGALLGLCFGAFFIWLILVGVRSIGSIAEAQVQARPKQEHSVSSAEPSLANLNTDSVTTALARLKNSVELGPVGDAVKKTDVMPTGVYQTLGETGTVLSNPASAQRFLNFPGVKEMSENPKIVALRDDPEVAQLIAEGRVVDLLRHPKIIAVLNDPALTEQVKHFDLKKALEYAKKQLTADCRLRLNRPHTINFGFRISDCGSRSDQLRIAESHLFRRVSIGLTQSSQRTQSDQLRIADRGLRKREAS